METLEDIKILKEYSILYVEDDIENRSTVYKILKDTFKEVFVAKDGLEGIESFKINKPDIILTDITMPNMNGLEMAKNIIAIDQNMLICIITAHDDNRYLKESINLGIIKYVLKPINMFSLVETLISMAKKLALKEYEKTKIVRDRLFAMDEMIKNITHQWRQPLSVISTSASGIKLEKELGVLEYENELKYLDNIISESKHLSKILDNFKDIKSLSYGIKMKDFNLKDCIENAMFLSNKLFEAHNIKFITNLENIFINKNEKLLSQVFLEIFDNVKSTCDINKQKDCYLFIDTYEKDNEIFIILWDNLGGIDDEIIDRIFEPYFSTKHQKFGIGLGLYVVRKLIQDIFKDEIKIYNKKFEYNNKNYVGACLEIKIYKTQENIS